MSPYEQLSVIKQHQFYTYIATNKPPNFGISFGKNVAPLLRVKLLRLCVQQGQSITML